jgi:membrane protease YdiL (CAAX protease family)
VTPTPPQGWYQDPAGHAGTYRYWSGSAWTEHTYDAGATPPWQGGVPGAGPGAGPWAGQAPAQQVLPPPPRYMVRPQVTTVRLEEPTRRALGWETAFVMVAFLLPAVVAAVVLFAQHVSGVGSVTRFPVAVNGHPLENMLIDIVAYLPVACIVPLALFLLSRTGQGPDVLGLKLPGLRSDIIPAIGIGAASFGTEVAILIPLAPLLTANSRLNSPTPVGTVPHYYVILGLTMAATSAIAEEVLMNGYLMTRLGQLGWSPNAALVLGLVLRTSYHVYYGLGFIATIPLGYFVTRSFQKHGRLTRPIMAHFLYDAVLITIAVLASH